MNRKANNVPWMCALCCCALAGSMFSAEPASAEQANANTQLQTQDADARMKHLAERLIDTDTEADKSGGTPLAKPPGTSTEPDETQADVNAPAAPTRTPLLRSGSRLDAGTGTGHPESGSWLLQTITALGIVIGLALGVRYVYARLGGKVASHASPVVEVLSRTTVAPRSHVMLLRVGGRVLVVSDSSAGMRTLASLQDPEEVADILGAVSAAKPTSISKGFGQLLHRFTNDHETQDSGLDAVTDGRETPGMARDSVAGLLSRVRNLGRQGGAS